VVVDTDDDDDGEENEAEEDALGVGACEPRHLSRGDRGRRSPLLQSCGAAGSAAPALGLASSAAAGAGCAAAAAAPQQRPVASRTGLPQRWPDPLLPHFYPTQVLLAEAALGRPPLLFVNPFEQFGGACRPAPTAPGPASGASCSASGVGGGAAQQQQKGGHLSDAARAQQLALRAQVRRLQRERRIAEAASKAAERLVKAAARADAKAAVDASRSASASAAGSARPAAPSRARGKAAAAGAGGEGSCSVPWMYRPPAAIELLKRSGAGGGAGAGSGAGVGKAAGTGSNPTGSNMAFLPAGRGPAGVGCEAIREPSRAAGMAVAGEAQPCAVQIPAAGRHGALIRVPSHAGSAHPKALAQPATGLSAIGRHGAVGAGSGGSGASSSSSAGAADPSSGWLSARSAGAALSTEPPRGASAPAHALSAAAAAAAAAALHPSRAAAWQPSALSSGGAHSGGAAAAGPNWSALPSALIYGVAWDIQRGGQKPSLAQKQQPLQSGAGGLSAIDGTSLPAAAVPPNPFGIRAMPAPHPSATLGPSGSAMTAATAAAELRRPTAAGTSGGLHVGSSVGADGRRPLASLPALSMQAPLPSVPGKASEAGNQIQGPRAAASLPQARPRQSALQGFDRAAAAGAEVEDVDDDEEAAAGHLQRLPTGASATAAAGVKALASAACSRALPGSLGGSASEASRPALQPKRGASATSSAGASARAMPKRASADSSSSERARPDPSLRPLSSFGFLQR
jgi:hypothetical protein